MLPDVSIIMVSLPDASYGISVRAGLIRGAGHVLPELSTSDRVAIVTDAHVAPHYLALLEASLRERGYEPLSVVIPTGEDAKNLHTVGMVYDRLLESRIERSTPLIALGGGMVGDITGFVAATVLRGIPFIQMPTTLLAMVDASVGGKTGVNHAVGKNLIGSFHQPIAVLADVEALRTLPPRELRAGLAECIKHDIIRDGEGFNRLERTIDRALALDLEYLTSLITHNVMIKAAVVEADPFEDGERAHLNFGHTFGHAIEKVCKFSMLHGECVAMGIVAASRLAARLGMMSENNATRIRDLLARAELPVSGLTLSTDEVMEAMRSDKKVVGGKMRFVLPDRIGHVVVRDNVSEADARWAIESLR